MHPRRSTTKFHPTLEQFESKQLLSTVGLGSHPGKAAAHARALAEARSKRQTELPTRFLVFRVTNPSVEVPYALIPPFQQVLVQSKQPVAGQVYNVLQISVKNGTAQTFTASNDFQVKLSGGKPIPILSGSEEWKPNQIIVFYVLTKKYYPVSPVSGGFVFDLGGASSTAVPGPSGIFLRLKYNRATFATTLNWIVAYGQGNEGGAGAKYGLPDTSIYEFVAATTRRSDFGGHF